MSEQLQLRRGSASQVAAFTGAQGELAVDTTNNRLVVQDGATAGGWPQALATRTQVSDAAYAVLVTDRQIAYTVLTAARAVTLPAASSYPTGAKLEIFDESGNCSLSKTITVGRAGSDTISGNPGSTTSVALSGPNSAIALESNGVSQWTILHSRLVGAARTAVSDAAYAALITDRLIAYTAITASRTVTLPAAAAFPAGTPLFVVDESGAVTATDTIVVARAGSDTINSATSATIATANGFVALESNGSNAWTLLGAQTTANKGSNAPYVLGQSRIPFVLVSSGTMGNNGALSAITAVTKAYPHAYVYLPAGAIAAGSLAGWYYAVFSSTTAATIYNNKYSSGTPVVPGSPTAFSTTGPGAYTQTTATEIAAYNLSVAGNTIGPNGAVRITRTFTCNNSAGAKNSYETFGGAAQTQNGLTASVANQSIGGFANAGVTNAQTSLLGESGYTGAFTYGPTYTSVDTTATQSLIEYLELAVATDSMALEGVLVELIPGVP